MPTMAATAPSERILRELAMTLGALGAAIEMGPEITNAERISQRPRD